MLAAFGALLFAAPSAAQTYGSESGDLVVEPSSVTVTITGEGFSPDSTVLIRIVDEAGETVRGIGTLRSDDDGAITGEFDIDVVPGEVAILAAIGQTPDGATLTLSGSMAVGVGGELPDLEPEPTPSDEPDDDEPDDDEPSPTPPDEEPERADEDGSDDTTDEGDGGGSALIIVLVILAAVVIATLATLVLIRRRRAREEQYS